MRAAGRDAHTPEPILAGLDARQLEAATAVGGPVLIEAPAGSGKTTTIAHRIAHGIHLGAFESAHVLAISFTNRAAGELRTRLAGLGCGAVSVRTFHSAALRQLRYFWQASSAERLPELRANRAETLAAIASSDEFELTAAENAQVVGIIELAKAQAFQPSQIESFLSVQRLLPDISVAADVIELVYERYESSKTELNEMDFDDVVSYLVGILDADASAAAAVRRQYRHVTIDEFQDTTFLQRALLRAWTGPSRDVCAVGDPCQSIYAFAGAGPEGMTWFKESFPDCAVIRLDTCYRSTEQVVQVGARLRRQLGHGGQIASARGPGESVAVLPLCRDEVQEARAIAEHISARVQQGVETSDIAVLFRIGSQAAVIEQELSALGIAASAPQTEKFFDSAVVRKAITLLRGAARDPHLRDVPLADVVSDVLATMGWTPQMPAMLGSMRQDWLRLDAIRVLAREMEMAQSSTSVDEVVAALDDMADAGVPPTVNAITLATAHSSKGAQWRHVYISGMNEGLFPYGSVLTADGLDEERRLFYVAATRARDSLVVSGFGRWSAFVGDMQPQSG